MKQHIVIIKTALVILICLGVGTTISSISESQGAIVVGGIKAGSAFKWDFNYTGTDIVGLSVVAFANIDSFELSVAQVQSNGDFNLNYSDSGYRVGTPIINPNDALKMLPLGTEGNHSSATTLKVADIIAPISMISVNWKEQQEFYIYSTTLSSIPRRNVTHHTKYPFQGIWADVYIFQGHVSQTHFGEEFIGYFRLVYSAKHGFMLEYEVNLSSVSSSSMMAFTITLTESNMSIGYSFFQNFLVGFCTSFGFQWIYSLILIGIIYAKKRFNKIDYGVSSKDEEKLEEIEDDILTDEEGKKITPVRDIHKDYNFIYECPFCGEKFEKYERICSACGGKR